jgi:hypothetical protein
MIINNKSNTPSIVASIRRNMVIESSGQQWQTLPRSFLHPAREIRLPLVLRHPHSFAEFISVVAVYADVCEIGHHLRVDGKVGIEHLRLQCMVLKLHGDVVITEFLQSASLVFNRDLSELSRRALLSPFLRKNGSGLGI